MILHANSLTSTPPASRRSFQPVSNSVHVSRPIFPLQNTPLTEDEEFLLRMLNKYSYSPEGIAEITIPQFTYNLARHLVYDLVMDSNRNLQALPSFTRSQIPFSRDTYGDQIDALRVSYTAIEDSEGINARNQFLNNTELSPTSADPVTTFLRQVDLVALRLSHHQGFKHSANRARANFCLGED